MSRTAPHARTCSTPTLSPIAPPLSSVVLSSLVSPFRQLRPVDPPGRAGDGRARTCHVIKDKVQVIYPGKLAHCVKQDSTAPTHREGEETARCSNCKTKYRTSGQKHYKHNTKSCLNLWEAQNNLRTLACNNRESTVCHYLGPESAAVLRHVSLLRTLTLLMSRADETHCHIRMFPAKQLNSR